MNNYCPVCNHNMVPNEWGRVSSTICPECQSKTKVERTIDWLKLAEDAKLEERVFSYITPTFQGNHSLDIGIQLPNIHKNFRINDQGGWNLPEPITLYGMPVYKHPWLPEDYYLMDPIPKFDWLPYYSPPWEAFGTYKNDWGDWNGGPPTTYGECTTHSTPKQKMVLKTINTVEEFLEAKQKGFTVYASGYVSEDQEEGGGSKGKDKQTEGQKISDNSEIKGESWDSWGKRLQEDIERKAIESFKVPKEIIDGDK